MLKIRAMNLGCSICLGSLLLQSVAIASDETQEAELKHELDPYVVVATRTPIQLERVSPSVKYISLSEMEDWQDHDLVDVLMRQSGVSLKNGSIGAVASLFLRGTNSDQTAFFRDGRRMNRTLSGQYDLEFLNVDNLSSVQIQKGASSVNYGSSGIGGVIDLQTQKSIGKNSTNGSVTGRFGSNNYEKGTITFQTSKEDWGISLSHTSMSTDNERDNDRTESHSSNFRGDVRLGPNLTAELVAHYSEYEKRVPGSTSNPSPNAFNVSENWLLSPGLRVKNNDFNIHTFYSREYFKTDNTYNSGFISYDRLKTDEINLQIDYYGIEDLTLTLGCLYRSEEIEKPSTYFEKLDHSGGFVQSLWQINDAIEVRGGIRYDSFSDYEDSWTWNLELIHFVPNTNLSFFAKIASAYAPPTGQDISYDDNKDSNGNTVNTPILPEESLSYEIGLRQQLLSDRLQLNAVLFRNEIDNYIRYVQYTSNHSDTLSVNEATTEGLELSINYEINPELVLNLGYTYLTAVYDSYIQATQSYEVIRLSERPRHSIQASIHYQPTEIFKLGLSATSQSDRESFNWQDYNSNAESFFVLNCVAELSLSENFSILARVDNLLDESYATSKGYPNLGTSHYIGGRLKF